MTWGDSSLSMRALLVAGVVATLGVGACGGGSHKSTTATTTTTTTTAQKPAVKPKPTLRQLVGIVGAKSLTSSVAARPGQQVEFHTFVPGNGKLGGGAQTVELTVATGPSKSLTVTAGSGGHTSKAVLTSTTGKSLTLQRLHYACSLPPAPTFCPIKNLGTNSTGVHMKFSATRKSGITVLGTIGPTNLPIPKSTSPGTSLVPAYKVTELVKPLPKNPSAVSSTAPPTSSVAVKPGADVLLISRVTSKLHGAPQPVTITVDQGPGSSLTASASVPGGPVSTATVKSANGSKIAIVLPRYSCFLPPFPTFCPALSTKARAHAYTVKFDAAPGASPPVLLVSVQAG